MEIHQLRYFTAIAKTGSFTRAAQQEHVAQPSLSQQIGKLEHELGAKLFDRLGRRVRLTAFGEAFLRRANTVIVELNDAKIEIQQMTGRDAGAVVVGVIPTIAPYFLPKRLSGFVKKHRDIQLSLVEEMTPALMTRLQEGSIDMALIALPVPGPEFTSREFMRESMYLVVPKNHPLALERSARLSSTSGEPFLLLKEGHCFRESVISACQRSKITPNVVLETGQFSTVLGMVAAGVGISVVPKMAVEKHKGCVFIPLADERAYRRIGMVWLRSHFQSRAEKALLTHLDKTS